MREDPDWFVFVFSLSLSLSLSLSGSCAAAAAAAFRARQRAADQCPHPLRTLYRFFLFLGGGWTHDYTVHVHV